jgi:uncharacterized protein YukE
MSSIPNVKWNHADADAAARALQRAASELRRTAGDRTRAAQAATAEWRGKHRETFDEHLRKTLSAAEDLARRYDNAARRINSASSDAREEQRRRERKREEQQRRARG